MIYENVPADEAQQICSIVDDNSAKERCENIFLTPWHTHPDHQPLGGINRLRRAVYDTSRDMRLRR